MPSRLASAFFSIGSLKDPGAPMLLVVRQDPVGETLQAGAQALVLQVLDEAAIAQRQLGDDRARERRVLVEDARARPRPG